MSVFGWFSRKQHATPNPSEQPDTLAVPPAAQQASTDGQTGGAGADSRVLARKAENAALREQLRTQVLARREQLYGVVREAMLRVGVPVTSYKFKVLALDQSGRLYLVMIDLASHLNHEAAQMVEVESLIAQSAKSQHDIVVSAVYWRTTENLGEVKAHPGEPGRADAGTAQVKPANQPVTDNSRKAEPATEGNASGHYEPLQTDEMLAFKRALAATATAPAPAAPARPPARAYSPLATGYEDTQVVGPDTRPPGLGGTQYGDFN